ncbi:uncharacterized protein LOC112599733 [Melanaphis sacchari]|uniref:uncharacterized protein LOC112599733 n=1 Tax=Melanaphis sacchari TaxID=742174 RepID=UPI000DC15951|nr:uncharacterized protein LOC112599733 [Melanaphis sacchari]
MAADTLRVLRKRSLEEYDDDYKPLSKRMHSMYLKDGPLAGENHLAVTNAYGNASTSTQYNQQTATDYSHSNVNNQQSIRVEDTQNLHYDPDLTSDQNPYYYESNRLLFDLHVERVHRHGQ